ELPQETVAYFSMEICPDQRIPTYSGGSAVLAGDTLRSPADLGVPMVAVTPLHRKGYFHQHIDESGQQIESPVAWNPEDLLTALEPRCCIAINGRTVYVRAWRYTVHGQNGH